MRLAKWPQGRPHRPPTATLKELAKEFGVTVRVLQGRMAHGAPKAELITTKTHYYDAAEMRTWWANLQGQTKCQA